MNSAHQNLKEYYDRIYKSPNTELEAISTIIDVYKNKMEFPTEKTKNGINEVFRELTAKGLPAYYWFLEAIFRTSKKRDSKKSFPYMIGMLRNWTLYGFGNTHTDEEEEIFDYFTELTNVNISANSRVLLTSLMGAYGALKLMRTMPQLKEIDVSVALVEALGKIMRNKYDEINNVMKLEVATTIEALPQQSYVKEPVVTESYRGTPKPIENDNKLAAKEVAKYLLKCNTPVRPVDIAQMLIQKGFKKYTNKNISPYLKSFMSYEPNVVKVGTGQYWHKSKTWTNQ